MKGLIVGIIGAVVAIYVMAILAPDAITMLANGTFTGVNASVKTMFTVILPIIAVVALALMLLKSR